MLKTHGNRSFSVSQWFHVSLLLGLQALRREGDYSVMFCSIHSVTAVFLLQNAEEETLISGCNLLRLLTDC